MSRIYICGITSELLTLLRCDTHAVIISEDLKNNVIRMTEVASPGFKVDRRDCHPTHSCGLLIYKRIIRVYLPSSVTICKPVLEYLPPFN